MTATSSLDAFVPEAFRNLEDLARDLPRLAKDPSAAREIDAALRQVPTKHKVILGDARCADFPPGSAQLVLTSPPYWTLKEYRRCDGQLGWIADYDEFLNQLDLIWRMCYRALTPGGRLVCVVGDVCLSRRGHAGRHMVVPLHASIQERCRALGFDNLAPIIWSKIANVQLYSPEIAIGYIMIFDVQEDRFSTRYKSTWSELMRSRLSSLSGRGPPSWTTGMIEDFVLVNVDFRDSPKPANPAGFVPNRSSTGSGHVFPLGSARHIDAVFIAPE